MDNKLKDFINRDDCYFIHYASNGFYNGSSPAPKISCIVIYNQKNDKGYKFCIKDYIKGHSKEGAEKLTLENFKSLFGKYPNISFIHWNMTVDGFGFKAIQARGNELGIEIPTIPDKNLFDLSSYVAYIAEKKLSTKQVLWFNSLLYGDDYLDGKTEAEYFDKEKYDEIYRSVHTKVIGFSSIVDKINNRTLKIDKPFAEPNDGLTKEERRTRSLKIEAVREQMLKDIANHNKKLLKKQEIAYEEFIKNYEPKCEKEDQLFLFDFNHPLISMFANWFANKK